MNFLDRHTYVILTQEDQYYGVFIFSCLKSFNAETKIFGERQDNTIDADAHAVLVARLSAAMILVEQNKRVVGIHEEGFQLPAPSQCWQKIEI